MNSDDKKVVVIGAGVSGLIAARHLSENGVDVTLLESEERPGGRVKTDHYNGFLLDHGFQVLLTEYEEVKNNLDVDALDLHPFDPGAVIFDRGKSYTVSDPYRNPGKALSALFSGVGTFRDKLRLANLVRRYREFPEDKIFSKAEEQTNQYLNRHGFSEKIIGNFFRPFFGGVFLDPKLETGARMFRFSFKKFSNGYAALPADGMEAVVKQLHEACQNVDIRFNSPVSRIEGGMVELRSGESISPDKIIVATEPSRLLKNLASDGVKWRSTATLYFSANQSPLDKPMIALNTNPYHLINTFCVPSDLSPKYAPNGKSLISVSLKQGWDMKENEMIDAVREELEILTGMERNQFEHLKTYVINEALPVVRDLQYSIPGTQTQLTDNVYVCGDHMLNPSLDGAMRSGRIAAEAVMAQL